MNNNNSEDLLDAFDEFTKEWRGKVDLCEYTTAEYDYLFTEAIPNVICTHSRNSTIVGQHQTLVVF